MIPLRGGLSALIFGGALKKQPMNTILERAKEKKRYPLVSFSSV